MTVHMFSKLCNECSKCSIRNRCNHKRMVACASLQISKPNMENIIVSGRDSSIALRKLLANLRNVKLDSQTTITVDLEDVKKQIENDFFKSMNCSFMRR